MKTLCSNCKARFKVSDKYIGKKVKCPKCDTSFVIKANAPPQKKPAAVSSPEQVDPLKAKEFLSVKELASVLSVNPITVYRMVSRGEITCYQIGRCKRFRKSDIEDYLKSCVIK